MNAQRKAAEFILANIADLQPSQSNIQKLRRSRFDKEALAQLAASITQVGVAEPILLRSLKDKGYEIVAGERRWLAAKIAGLTQIPAMVSSYTDAEALELQLIENLQREDLHEMEEAEGYSALRALKGLSAEQIATQVGKSRSQVFARLKLLELCPAARKAFYAGKFTASVALLVARIPQPELQQQLMEEIAGDGEWYFDGEEPTYREVLEHVQADYMVDLKSALFDTKVQLFSHVPKGSSLNAVPIGVACTACPKRSGNQADLFTDVKNPNVCTDPKCFQKKQDAYAAKVREDLEAKGGEVITGEAASKIVSRGGDFVKGGYVAPDAKEWLDGKLKTYKDALGKDMPAPRLVEDPDTKRIIPVLKESDLATALKAKGIKKGFGSDRGGGRDRQNEEERRARIETQARMRILRAIRVANRGRKYDLADLRLVASRWFERMDFDSEKRVVDDRMAEAGEEKGKGFEYVHDWVRKVLPTLSPDELAALMIDAALIGECHVASYNVGGQAKLLWETARRLKIDPDKIRAAVKAEHAEKKEAKKKAARKSATKTAKKAVRK